jgi:hypothetical protein
MDKPNGSIGQETRKRDRDMHRIEEVKRCMPTRPIPYTIHR